jgi:hypothetical protein
MLQAKGFYGFIVHFSLFVRYVFLNCLRYVFEVGYIASQVFDCQAIEKTSHPRKVSSSNRSFDCSPKRNKCSPVAVLKNSLFEFNLQDKNYLVGIK